jgi:ATP-dependent exoDNAse (exonuclease V) alpha subunit
LSVCRPGEGRIEPFAHLLRIQLLILEFREHDAAQENLAPHVELASERKLPRLRPRLGALLPALQLRQTILQRRDLIIEFRHGLIFAYRSAYSLAKRCTYTSGIHLAIYHLTASVVSRAHGKSIVAVAAARSASKLYDRYYGATHNFARASTVAHTEILAPSGLTGAFVQDREELWNQVEAAEKRKDAQLARDIEVALPVELSLEQCVALLREYVANEFVSQGMIADLSVWHHGSHNPRAHILLTLRDATSEGFALKARRWNRKDNILRWRAAWAECANRHLAKGGHAVRIDHRTLEAQQIELVAAPNVGVGAAPQSGRALPDHIEDRIVRRQRVARENGAMILEDPAVALRALSRQRAVFSAAHLEQFLRSRTDGPVQLEAALAAVLNCAEITALGTDGSGKALFTSKGLEAAEKSLLSRARVLRTRRGHALGTTAAGDVDEQILADVVGAGDLKMRIGPADAAKGRLLAAAASIWATHGLRVMGAARLLDAAKALFAPMGIQSFDLEALEPGARAPLEFTDTDVLIIDGAEMLDLYQLERILAAAEKGRAKLLLLGDAALLAAMGRDSPLQRLI